MIGAWLALAGVFAVIALPGGRAARLGHLVAGGRLAGPKSTGRGRSSAVRTPWARSPGPAGVLAVALLVAAAIGAVYLSVGPLLAVAAAAVAATCGVLAADLRAGRRSERLDAQQLAAVRVLAGELRAGSAPAEALAAAAQVAPLLEPEFAAAAAAARRGESAGRGLAASGHRGVRVTGSAWAVGEATGAALASVLGRVAADLEAAAAQRRATSVALAGPRSSAAVLTGLPALGIALGAAMGAHPVGFLLADPAGRAVCCAGVLLDAAGVLWVRQILRRAGAPP